MESNCLLTAIQAYMSQPLKGTDDKRIQLRAGIVSAICLSPSSCISNFYSYYQSTFLGKTIHRFQLELVK